MFSLDEDSQHSLRTIKRFQLKTTAEKAKKNVLENKRYSFVGSKRVVMIKTIACLSGSETTRSSKADFYYQKIALF